MRFVWTFFLFAFVNSNAGDIKAYQYERGNEEYFVIEDVKEDSVPSSVESSVVIISAEEKEREDYLERERRRAAILKNEEYFILRLVQEDRYFELKEYLKKEGSLERLNKRLTVVDTFKYPLHQAILNKSYRVLFVLLNLDGLKVDLVEDSGRTTLEILKINGFGREGLGEEIMEKYLNKQKKGANK